MVKNPLPMQETQGSIPELGRSPRGGNGNTLQYSCLENSMGRAVRWATVHGGSELDTSKHALIGDCNAHLRREFSQQKPQITEAHFITPESDLLDCNYENACIVWPQKIWLDDLF